MRPIREESPLNAETPLDRLTGEPVPASLFYVRNHCDVPDLEPSRWTLRVAGRVATELELGLDDLRALPHRSLPVTMECAGNGRRSMEPSPGGVPWGFGAVATAEFGGTPLRHVLERAGLADEAVEIGCVGADAGEVAGGRREPFARSLPPEVALDADTLLAWTMNGESLTAEHGRPVRLVVPGWYAMASVKWLVRIDALAEPFEGHYQGHEYVYVGDGETPDGTPCTTKRVRAVIARPAEGERLATGPVRVRGTAWSGDGPVVRVEVSVDGGGSWDDAELTDPPGEYAASPWRYAWTPSEPGEHTLVARATDATGRNQPLTSRWNRHGYGNNVVHRVRVAVEGSGR